MGNVVNENDTHLIYGITGNVVNELTLALNAPSFKIISTVNRTVKILFSVSDRSVMCSDWLQCCTSRNTTEKNREIHFTPFLNPDSAY